MKQIIVSVHGLSVEKKNQVNEALAKITGATKLPDTEIGDGWLFATEALDSMVVTSDWLLYYGDPTHSTTGGRNGRYDKTRPPSCQSNGSIC